MLLAVSIVACRQDSVSAASAAWRSWLVVRGSSPSFSRGLTGRAVSAWAALTSASARSSILSANRRRKPREPLPGPVSDVKRGPVGGVNGFFDFVPGADGKGFGQFFTRLGIEGVKCLRAAGCFPLAVDQDRFDAHGVSFRNWPGFAIRLCSCPVLRESGADSMVGGFRPSAVGRRLSARELRGANTLRWPSVRLALECQSLSAESTEASPAAEFVWGGGIRFADY